MSAPASQATVYVLNNREGMTQFGRALSELNVEILCANSSQAKGRVDRADRTLQDRPDSRCQTIVMKGLPAFSVSVSRMATLCPYRVSRDGDCLAFL